VIPVAFSKNSKTATPIQPQASYRVWTADNIIVSILVIKNSSCRSLFPDIARSRMVHGWSLLIKSAADIQEMHK
jgi:hypothetical protein